MDHPYSDAPGANAPLSVPEKSGTRLALIALGLEFFSLLLLFLLGTIYLPSRAVRSFLLLVTILAPVAGVVMAVYVLYRGRGQKGFPGKSLAIAAIVLPLLFLALMLAAIYMLSQAMSTGM